MSELSRVDYDALCQKIGTLLRAGGIVIERAIRQGGQITDWEAVPAETLIGRLQAAFGWRIREIPPDLEARVLTLVRETAPP